MDGRLPPIFDDRHKLVVLNDEGAPRWYGGLMLVDDPDELYDYARGLWWQWQALERNDTTAEKGYSKTKVRRALAWLLGRYADVQAPIPDEVALLGSAALAHGVKDAAGLPSGASPVQERNERAYAAAARHKAEHPTSTPLDVAKALCDAGLVAATQTPDNFRTTVEDWFKTQHFKDAVASYRRSAG